MRRKTFDYLAIVAGAALAVMLLVAGGLLTWAGTFVGDQVHDQLAAQDIYFPEAGSESLPADEFPDLQQYGGQQLLTGAQAKAYADDYIAAHIESMTGGKSYSEVSAASQANPDDEEAAALVQTVFRGETLRGLLLYGYAFATMGQIATIASYVAYAGAVVMLVLVALGVRHARRTPEDEDLALGRGTPAEEPAPAAGDDAPATA